MNQIELESMARYFVGTGVVFADDFIQKNIGPEKMKRLSIFGAYVIKMSEPTPCLFISFGAGVGFIANSPVAKLRMVSKTEAEHLYLSYLIEEVDPENKYQLRAHLYHLDLAHGAIIRRPSDEEIANLQLRYRDSKKPPKKSIGRRRFTIKSIGRPNATKTSRPAERLARELRALDRRRFSEAGIVPPPERAEQLAIIKDGPRRGGWKIKMNKLDTYRSDTDEEEPGEVSKLGEKIERVRDLFDDTSSESEDDARKKREQDDNDGLHGIDIKEDDDGEETIAQPPIVKRSKLPVKSEPTPLERVLTAMQEGYRQRHPQQ